jgi:signal transduction histidine kinase
MAWKPRLRAVLLIINLGILLLPLSGIGVLRLYESELCRRTEAELIAQGVLIGAAYREELLEMSSSPPDGDNVPLNLNVYGLPVGAREKTVYAPSGKYHPVMPGLQISEEVVRPPAPAAAAAIAPPDPYAAEAGRRITPLLLESKDKTLVGIRMLDYRGTAVASTGGELGLSLANREEVTRALAGDYVSLLRLRMSNEPAPPLVSVSRGTLMRVFVGMPVVHEGRVLGVVLLSRTPMDIRKALYNERVQIILAALVIVGVVLLVSILTSLTVSRPLKALVNRAERIVRGERTGAGPSERAVIREIEQLSRAIVSMAGTLEQRADYIRTFAANVSHEFKTPLTSIRGTVELLGEHIQDMSREEKDRFLRFIADDTERLDRLVRRLLDLARADTCQPGSGSTIVAESLERLAARYGTDGIIIETQQENDSPAVRMSGETFESLVSNLIENSRQHGGDGVSVHISVCGVEERGERFVRIDFRDNGHGIPAGNRDKVFRPFFTTARERGGSGLGLSIVRSLVTAHGGVISLEPSDGGAFFRILLPRSATQSHT